MKKKEVCEYENCGKPRFGVEKLTGTDMNLCFDHIQKLMGNIIRNAKIVDETGEED